MRKQLLLAALSFAMCGKAQVLMTESFEGTTFPPTGWTLFNNGMGYDWVQNPTGTLLSYPASNGVQTMAYEWSSDYAADAWAFTPGLNLSAGDSIEITFDYMVADGVDYYESMKVTMGMGQTVSDQTTVLWDQDSLVNESYQTATIGILVGANGTYNFAFNCYSIADQFTLLVDNVKIRKVLPSDLQMNPYMGVTRSCSFTANEQIVVNFSNVGASSETNVPVAYSINGTAVSETYMPQITGGGSTSYTFTTGADFSAPGTYNVKIYTQLATDADRSNDTVAFTVVSDATGLMMKTSLDTSFIPDNDSNGVISALPFCGIANNLGTNIRINRVIIESIIHTYPDDLTLELISPAGDTLILAQYIGADNPDYPMITFTDTAVTNIIVYDEDPILTGYYHTQDSIGFAKFDGQDPNGVWKLWITDGYAADYGYLTSWTLEFDNAVGIHELKASDKLISVYPNPNNGIFTMRAATHSAVTATIYGLNGQLLQTTELSGTGTQTVDLRGFAKGMYIVKAVSEDAVQTSKIVIE